MIQIGTILVLNWQIMMTTEIVLSKFMIIIRRGLCKAEPCRNCIPGKGIKTLVKQTAAPFSRHAAFQGFRVGLSAYSW